MDDLADKRRVRRLDGAYERGDFKYVLNEAFVDRSAIRQHAAELLIRGGYDRVAELIRDACVDLCRQRTELRLEKMPENTIEMVVKQNLDIQVYIDKWIARRLEVPNRN